MNLANVSDFFDNYSINLTKLY